MAKSNKKQPDPEVPECSWADNTGRHAGDALLRRHGFQILERPEKGEPVWVRNGTKYLESVAHKVVQQEFIPSEGAA